MRRFAAVLVCCALLGTAGVPASSASASPYTIDAVLSLTGPYAFVGNADEQSLRIFENDANAHGGLHGQPIHFEVHDDQSSPQVAVQISQQLIAKHPAVIIGSNGGSLCNAMLPLFKDGPVLYCLAPSIYATKNGYVFATQVALDPFVNGMFRYLRLRGLTRFAIISSTDGSGAVDDTATNDVLKYPENRDIRVVVWEHFNPNDVSIAAQATHIRDSNAQVVIAWAAGTPFGTVLRGLNDAGVRLPVETTNANMHSNQLAQYASFYPQELVMPGVPYFIANQLPGAMHKPVADFLAAFAAAHTKPEPGASPFVWDVATIVLSGLRKLGPSATAADLKNYILNLKSFAGIDGIYDFTRGDQHGLSDQSVVMASWDLKTQEFYAVSGLGGMPLGKRATAP